MITLSANIRKVFQLFCAFILLPSGVFSSDLFHMRTAWKRCNVRNHGNDLALQAVQDSFHPLIGSHSEVEAMDAILGGHVKLLLLSNR
jgi:hypothetical protein